MLISLINLQRATSQYKQADLVCQTVDKQTNNQTNLQRATSQYKQAGEWDKAAETLATMADIYRRQVLMMLLLLLLFVITILPLLIMADIDRLQVLMMILLWLLTAVANNIYKCQYFASCGP